MINKERSDGNFIYIFAFRAGCTLNVKDFKASWRSGVVFLAILYALRPDVVDLTKARTRSNKQNLEEAFRIAEKELRIPRLLDPDGEPLSWTSVHRQKSKKCETVANISHP